MRKYFRIPITKHKKNIQSAPPVESNLTKNCPYCGEEILKVALKCKHCHSMISDLEKTTDSPSPDLAPPDLEPSIQNKKEIDKEISQNSFLISIWLIFGTSALFLDKDPSYTIALYSYSLSAWTENLFYRQPTESNYFKIRFLFWVSRFFSTLALSALALTAWSNDHIFMAILWCSAIVFNLHIHKKHKKEMLKRAGLDITL